MPDFRQMIPDFGKFEDYLNAPPVQMPAGAVPAAPAATGTGNLFTAGLGSGFYTMLSEFGRAGQAGAQFVGAPGLAKSASDYATQQEAAAASYARPDLESAPWYDPKAIAYRVTQGLPTLASALGAGFAASAAAPELAGAGVLGGAAAMYAPSVGGNVQRQIDAQGYLSDPGKALALGVPEAAIQGILPGKLEGMLEKPIAGAIGSAIGRGAIGGAVTQAGAGAATEFLTQKMGDPNRPFAQRAQDIVQAALGGAVQGGIFGGAIGAAGRIKAGTEPLTAKPAAEVTGDDLEAATAAIDPSAPPPELPPGVQPFAGAPGVNENVQGTPQPEPVQNNTQVVGPGEQLPSATQPFQGSAFPANTNVDRQIVGSPQELPGRVLPIAPDYRGPEPANPVMTPSLDDVVPPAPADRLSAFRVILQQAPIDDLQRALADREAERSQGTLSPEKEAVGQEVEAEIQRRFAEQTQGVQGTFDFGSREPTLEPTQLNIDLRGGSAQGDLFGDTSPQEGFQLGNEGNEPFDWTDQSKKLRQAAKGVPDELKGQTFKSMDDLQSAIAKAVNDRDAAGKTVPKRLTTWAEQTGIMKDGVLDPKFSPAPEAEPAATPPGITPAPAESTVAPVSRDAIKDIHQPRYDALDNISQRIDALGNDPDRMSLKSQATDLMNRLASPKPGEVSQIVKATKNLDAQVTGKEIAKSAGLDQPTQRPDAPATPDLQPSPQAAQEIAAKQARVAEAPPEPVAKPRTQAEAQAQRTALKLDPVDKLGVKVSQASTALQGDLDARTSKSAGVMKTMLAQHNQLAVDLMKAVKAKDVAKLQEIAKNPDYFPTDLYVTADRLKGKAADLVEQHAAAEEALLQHVRDLTGTKALVLPSRDGMAATQLDADVFNKARNGIALKDILGQIVEQHPDRDMAEIAAKLHPFVGNDEGTIARSDTTGKAAEYFPKLKTTAIYQAAGAAQAALHEAVHAVTHKAIDSMSPAGKAIRDVFSQLKGRGDDYGLSNVHEMVAEAYSNPRFRDFLRSQIVRGSSMWDRVTNAVRSFLGLKPTQYNALDRVMSLGDELIRDNATRPNPEYQPDSYASVADRGLHDVSNVADHTRASTVAKMAEIAQGARLNWAAKARGFTLGWVDGYHIEQMTKGIVPAVSEYTGLARAQESRKDILSRMGVTTIRGFDGLKYSEQGLIEKLMTATALNMDPRKEWAGNPQLHKLTGNNVKIAQQQHAQYRAMWNELNKNSVATQVYEQTRARHAADYLSSMATTLRTVAKSFANGVPGVEDAFNEYVRRHDIHNDPLKAEVFWNQKLNDQTKAMEAFRDTLTGERSTLQAGAQTPETITRARRLQSDAENIDALISSIAAKRKDMAESPYFHLGRNGDYMAATKLVMDPSTGAPDEAKFAKVQQRFEQAGFGDVAPMQGITNADMYMRLRSPSEASRMNELLKSLQKEGLIDPDAEIVAGDASSGHAFQGIAPGYMQNILGRLHELKPEPPVGASPEMISALDAAHENQVRDLQKILTNLMPEMSVSRLMARRANVQGFEKGMFANSIQASKVMAANVSRLSLTPDIGVSMKNMADQVRANNRNQNMTLDQRLQGSQAVAELMLREQQKQTYVPPTALDGLRHLTHMLHIGSSPAYALTLTSQLLTTTLPELGKVHGYARAAGMMFNSAPDTFRVLKAIASSPDWATAGITQDALEKARIASKTIKFVMNMVARGDVGISSYSRTMGEHSPFEEGAFSHGTGKNFKDAMNMIGIYSEMMPRLLTAFAARDLYNARPVKGFSTPEDYVSHAVLQSQGDWTASLNARYVGKGGMFGAITPLINQFMGWQIKMTTKMYREAHSAITGTPQERAQAALWMGGHAAAVAMLAGTLGLPQVSTAASVFDRLADWATDQDNWDVTASYRTFLANMFGKDMGEIIARGAPRALGMDFDHWGEGSIVPGSSTVNMLFEKRKLEDAERDWLKSMGGSSVGEVFSMASAMRDITNGDYMDGLIKIMPEFLKTPMEGYRLGQRNFVDKDGTALPISANGFDVALTAMGIDPAKEAEYQEVKREETGINTMRTLSAQNITRHLIMAEERQDPAMMQAWQGEAARYGQQHPGMLTPTMDFGRAFEEHIRAAMMARSLGLPVGVSPRDIAGRGELSYGNFGGS